MIHYSPEENGVSKYINCTLLEHVQAMLIAANLPKFLWTETLQHAAWLKNRTTTCTLRGRTPFEVVHKSKPNLESLPEWGTHVFMLQEGRGKLEEQAHEGGWAMYSPDSQGHHVYWPSKHHVTVERNVNFGRVVQHDTMAEGQQDIPVTQNQPHPTTAPPHMQTPAHLPVPHTDPLHGFKTTPADTLGCGQFTCKPSAYVCDLHQGIGVTSTHPSDPLLPHGVQPPSNELGSATLALAEENKLSSFEFAMAVAAQAMRNDLGVKMWLMHCTTQPGAKRVLDIGFSSCAVPNYLIHVSEYFCYVP